MTESRQYTTKVAPTWCPGCGNFGILTALKETLTACRLAPHQVVLVTDVGCSGNMADFVATYVVHTLHGRALPVAAGIKLANHDLTVIAIIGDGGVYGEGLNHLINLMRGNHDLTVVVHNNGLYSLTTGQASPTTPKGQATKSTPEGVIEEPINPLALALSNHATFAARGYSANIPHLTQLLTEAVNHTGFGFIDVLQSCLTFNKNVSAEWTKKITPLKAMPKTKTEAIKLAQASKQLPIGLFWQAKSLAYHQQVNCLKAQPLVKGTIAKVDIGELVKEFAC